MTLTSLVVIHISRYSTVSKGREWKDNQLCVLVLNERVITSDGQSVLVILIECQLYKSYERSQVTKRAWRVEER
jgi:hypothetical protein